MTGWVRRILNPPVFEGDEDKTHVAALLNKLVIAALVVFTLYAAALQLVQVEIRYVWLWPRYLLLVGTLILMRRGWVRFACLLLVTGAWLVQIVSSAANGGVRAWGFGGNVVIVLLAGLLLGRRAALTFVALSIAAGLVMIHGEARGFLPPPPTVTPERAWMTQAVWFVLAAILLHLATSSISEALKRAREELAERKRAERALEQSENLLSSIINNTTAVIYVKLIDGRYLLVNKRYEELFDISRDEIKGKTDYDIFPKESADQFRTHDLEVIETRSAAESEEVVPAPDGTLRTYLSLKFPLFDSTGGLYATCGISTDITERKQAEEALRESERRFAKAFNASPLPMSIGKEGVFIDVNESLLRISGYTREEIIGRSVAELGMFVDPDDLALMRRLIGEKGSFSNLELDLRMKNGEIRPHLVSAETIELRGENCLLMVGNDITERKQAEEAERNKVQLIIQRQKALLELEQTEPQDLDSRLRQITAVAAKILEVDRVGVWFFDEGRSAIRCNHLYHRSKDLHGVGPTFHAKQYPRYFEALRTNRVVAAPDARTDPRTSEFREGYLEPLGITSMMDVPIWVQGEVVGIVCHEHTGPARQWLPEEQGFAGSVADLISVAVETSQRKRAEDALRASEEKYRQLVENLYDVIVASDNEGRITYISPAVFTLTGYSPSEIVGRPFLDFVHPEDAALAWQNFQNNLAGMPQTFELRVVTKSGEAIWVRSNARAIQSKGRVTGALGVMTDITERKRAEESQAQLQAAIRDVATEWRLTFDAVEFPVLLLDMTGSVRRINRAAQELTGRRYEDVLGQSIAQLGKGQPWLKAAEVVDLIRERHAPPCQVKDDLTGKTWEITATLYTGPRENRTGVILIIRDITRMVELQESLRHSETMSALGQLVSGVAHEVRNPLFGISATIDALEASLASVAGYERHMEVLRRELGRLSDLMRDLLDYGTPPSLELSVQHIDDVIAQAMKSCVPLADQSRVQLTKVGGVTRPLTLDKRRAIQVFQNLVDNAIRHSPVGGVVIIEVEETQQNGQTWIECRVKDSGPGIREADKSRIFEPFFTRRRGGTGLGLSIVQRIVEQHEGVIRAGNRPEGGAEITVRFPAVSRARGGRLKARS